MENTSICRCCATEGSFKDIKNPYYWMGEEEVYADIIQECFDIKLSSTEQGGICEVCITQLRNASNFKKQVLNTEEQFKKHIQDLKFKATIVKEEVSAEEDDNDKFDSDDNLNQDDDDEDYVPEYEIPIKTETLEVKPKKRSSSAKATTSKSKKSKNKDEDSKSSSDEDLIPKTQHIKLSRDNFCHFISIPPIEENNSKKNKMAEEFLIHEVDDVLEEPIKIKPKKKKIKKNPKRISTRKVYHSEMAWHLDNIKSVLEFSNATPVLSKQNGYLCCYCSKKFQYPLDLKTHTNKTHKDKTEPKLNEDSKNLLSKHIVYLDITNLKCNICNNFVDTLENLMMHLKTEHNTDMHLEIKNHIMPFKIVENNLNCGVCGEFVTFNNIPDHMGSHYKNYECELCNAVFINRGMKVDHQKEVHDLEIRL